jgi:hypothetical protein
VIDQEQRKANYKQSLQLAHKAVSLDLADA